MENFAISTEIQQMTETELVATINTAGSQQGIGQGVGTAIGNATVGLTQAQRLEILRLIAALAGG